MYIEMSAFSNNTNGVYSVVPDMKTSSGDVVVSTEKHPNANLELDSRDRITGTVAKPQNQDWNNFTITKGYNILQGQFSSIKLNEIRFPWSIPNVPLSLTKILIGVGVQNTPQTLYTLSIPPGFYTGTELVIELNNEITNQAIPVEERPVFSYTKDGQFVLSSPTGFTNSIFPTVSDSDLLKPITTNSLAKIMGFWGNNVDYSVPRQIQRSDYAPMLYTRYVDICSRSLTKYQNAIDTSTAQINKSNIICRLYCADNTNTQTIDSTGRPIIPGESPFIIYRQFVNEKVMRWNGQNSIDSIDIQVYDDSGNLCELLPGCTIDFQMTFQALEA
jgi:hypothetical protein